MVHPPQHEMPIHVLFLEVGELANQHGGGQTKGAECPTSREAKDKEASEELEALQETNKQSRVKSVKDVSRMDGRECHGREVSMLQGPRNIYKDPSRPSRTFGMFRGIGDTVIALCSRLFLHLVDVVSR